MILFYFWIVIQIVVESLPISSSGHQLLFERIFSFFPEDYFFSFFQSNIGGKTIDFLLFEHLLHIPTVLVLMIFFMQSWTFLLRNLLRCWRICVRLVLLTALANVVTVALILFFRYTEFSLPLSVNFCITGFLLGSLAWSDRCTGLGANGMRMRPRIFDFSTALILGFVQGLAIMPGISRFALVLATARFLGFTASKAFKVTFMVQWPLIAAASMQALYKLHACGLTAQLLTFNSICLVSGATLCAYFVFCFVADIYMRNKLYWLGIYMIVPALLALVW